MPALPLYASITIADATQEAFNNHTYIVRNLRKLVSLRETSDFGARYEDTGRPGVGLL